MNTNEKKRLIVFASGTAEGGGSGFENLVHAERAGIIKSGTIVAVVSNHEHGGVRTRAEKLGVAFEFMPAPFTTEAYQKIVVNCQAKFFALSGWLKLVNGLDPRTTFNIHPGPLPRFGGKGMHGHHVHEAVWAAHQAEGVAKFSNSAVTMHFVTEKYDEGPVFFVGMVPIKGCANADELGARVNRAEHLFQPQITERVLSGEISWDGKDPKSLSIKKPIVEIYDGA